VFGETTEGISVDLYTLVNKNGMTVRITNYGAIVVDLIVPGKDGEFDDVVLGYKTPERYIENNPYFGAIVGRYGNRIAKGKFTLDGTDYTLAINDGENHLHGGLKGFDKVVWQSEGFTSDEGPGVKLFYLSEDGEEGYPGNLNVTVRYILTQDNGLKIEYLAVTDKPTVLNLTNHSYFNLAGEGEGDILHHVLWIDADQITPVVEGLIPTGEFRDVTGTPFDFRIPTAIGERIYNDNAQLALGPGYDMNWVINDWDRSLKKAVTVYEPNSGRVMDVWTTEPGMQFYSGNFLDGSITGKSGKHYSCRSAIVLEADHFPDSPNQPNFPSVILRPGKNYSQTTIYQFSYRKQ